MITFFLKYVIIYNRKGFDAMKYKLFKLKFTLLRYFLYILMIIIISFFLFLVNGLIEMKPVDLIIDTFKERGIFEECISINDQKVNIYKVINEYDYEKSDTRATFRNINDSYIIGSNLDIIITNRNPLRFESTAIVQDIGAFFSKNFYIGHATININDDGTELIESVGNLPTNNGVRKHQNDWLKTEISKSNDAQKIIGLRVKGLNKEIIGQINNSLEDKVGLSYNYNLLIKKANSYYCTDLITRTLEEYNIKINYDGLYPTGNDMIISNKTYPIFLCERSEKGIFNIYYLCEV